MEAAKPEESILLRNTMAYDREHESEFVQAIRDAVFFAEQNAPQIMVQTFLDRANALCYSFQLHANSEAIQRHWEVSDPHISAVMKHCTVERMEVYGNPSQAVRDGIIGAVGSDKVAFTPALIGYYHFSESGQAAGAGA